MDIVDKKVDLDRPLIDYSTRSSESSFRRALSKGSAWMGLIYLMIAEGVQISSAIADALAVDKFQLVLTLLNKTEAAGSEAAHSQWKYLVSRFGRVSAGRW